MKIKDMRPEDRPRERFAESTNVSLVDLVSILIRTGTRGRAVTEVAQEVVDFLEAKEQDGIDFFDDLN